MLSHANYSEGMTVQLDRLAQRVGPATELPLPKVVAKDNVRRGPQTMFV